MNARLYDPMLHRFLQTDNYIQDITNTQNYNQYGYVYNNPLLYIDPSGNASQGGGDCIDCGLTPGQQVGAGGLIGTIVNNWDNWGIKNWAKKNFNGDNFSEWWKSKISFNNIFGRHKQHGPPPNMSSYVSLNNSNANNNFSKIKLEKSVEQRGKGGQAIGWGANTAVGGGIGYEIGFVTDENGGRALYFTFKGNFGLGSDFGMSVNKITPTHRGSFFVDDFAGTGNSHSASIGAWGYERGGTTGTNSGKEKIYRMGKNSGIDDKSYITNGGSRSYITPMTKGGFGYMFTESKTWIFKF